MRLLRAGVPLLTLTLALAACSSTGSGATPAASAQAPTAAASPSAAAGGVTVNLADTTLGKVLADGGGKTLYVFTADAAGKSNCAGDCANNWPALTSDAVPTLGTGLDAANFAILTRDDGTKQVTFFGHPLYYFAKDTAAGDVNGQGIGGKWFVVGADGNMVGAAASPAASAAASPSAAAGGVSVALADNALGKILVGADGKTLYVFTADSGGKSACNGDCATAWPPLIGDGAPTLGAGLDAEDFATIKRDDGSSQVTFYGMPVYYFAADAAAGDTKGQGLLSKWYVVDGDGKMIKK